MTSPAQQTQILSSGEKRALINEQDNLTNLLLVAIVNLLFSCCCYIFIVEYKLVPSQLLITMFNHQLSDHLSFHLIPYLESGYKNTHTHTRRHIQVLGK